MAVVLLAHLSANWDVGTVLSALQSECCVDSIKLSPTVDSRVKDVAWRLWLSNPILGIGPGNFAVDARQLLPSTHAASFALVPNSTYLALLSQYGSLGLIGWLGMLAAPFRRLRDQTETDGDDLVTLIFWMLCMVVLMFDLNIANFRFLYFMVPLLASMPQRNLGIPPMVDI